MNKTAALIVFDNFEVTPEMLKSIGIKPIDLPLEEIANTLARAKGDWLNGLMKEQLPADIFDCARSEHGDKRLKATRYIAREGFQIRENVGGPTELWKGNQLLGRFKVEIKDGKIQCFINKPTDQ